MNPWILAARPRTLPAAVVPVALGTAAAHRAGHLEPVAAGLCLAFALVIQVAANFANDYQDHERGTDTAERVGPARMVATGRISAAAMKRATYGTLALAFAIGCGLLPFGGWALLGVGLLCLLGALAYTGGPFPLGYHGLGEVMVFLFFGLIAVNCTYFVQAREFAPAPFALSLAVGALSANLLIVNNVRDLETDRKAGKKTLAARFGRGPAEGLYLGFAWLAAFAWPASLGLATFWGWAAAAVLAAAQAAAGAALWHGLRGAQTPPQFGRLLALTARHLALTGLLLTPAVAWLR